STMPCRMAESSSTTRMRRVSMRQLVSSVTAFGGDATKEFGNCSGDSSIQPRMDLNSYGIRRNLTSFALLEGVIPFRGLLAHRRQHDAVERVGRVDLLGFLGNEFRALHVELVNLLLNLLALLCLRFDVGFAFGLRHLLHLDGELLRFQRREIEV